MMHSQPPEQIFYQDNSGILVSTSRFVVGGTMYPMRGITAVQLVTLPPNRSVAQMVAILALGSLCLAGQIHEAAGVLCAALLALAIYLAVTAKGLNVVRVMTAGGQVDAVRSKDVAGIHQIVTALHRATMGG